MGMPLRIEGFDGVRDEGKEERDPCRLRLLLAVPLVPLVEGRYERTEVMLAANALQWRVPEVATARSKVHVGSLHSVGLKLEVQVRDRTIARC